MKKILTKILLCLVLVGVLLSTVSCGGGAADAEGTCGANLKWTYKAADRTLTVSGTGEMQKFASSSEVPWAAARSSAKKIVLEEGVTSVSDYAFYGFSALSADEELKLPATLNYIGKLSFAFCPTVKTIVLPQGLYSVGEGAFEGCSALTAVNLPATLTALGGRAYAFCGALTNVQILGTVDILPETFFNCTALTTVQFHDSITTISDTAFRGTTFTADKIQYTASKSAAAKLTVLFVDAAGNELQPAHVQEELAYDASYSVPVPSVEGYTADRPVVSGRILGVDLVEKVIYTKNEETTAAADAAATTAPEEDKGKGGSIVAVVIFAVVLVGIAVAAFLLIRSDKKNQGKSATVRKTDAEQNAKKGKKK